MKQKKHTTKERIEEIYKLLHILHKRIETLEYNNSATLITNKETENKDYDI